MKPLTNKCLWLLILILASRSIVIAQDFEQQLTKVKNIIPPSPDAASLGKYGDMPVSLFQGIPQVSVPIYELKGRSISIPISISYHASGIKVGEISSNIGLGWSLSGANNVISRTVRGLPDELTNAGYLDVRKSYPNPSDLSAPGNFSDSALMMSVMLQVKDSEPDLYYFNALGKSFEFFFSANDVIVTQPYSNVKIIADFPNKKFTAILEDGTKLFFGSEGYVEKTSNPGINSFVPAANNFVSTWHLKKILTVSNESIDFTYTPQTTDFDYNISEVDYNLVATYNCFETIGLPASKKVNSHTIYGLRINTIESELVSVKFIAEATERLDLTGNYALSKIKVFSKLDNKDVLEYDFIHSYSVSQASSDCPTGKCLGQYANRLKLDYLRQYKPNTTTKLKEWGFVYNSQTLPSRASYSQDHWGYYNGANNMTLLPSEPGFLIPDHQSGNREPNAAYTQAQILTQVNYPTGGSTTLTFEQNSYKTLAEVYKDSTLHINWDLNYDPNDLATKKSMTFLVNKPQNVDFYVGGVYSQIYRNYHSTMPRAAIKDPSGNVVAIIVEGGSQNLYLRITGTYTFEVTRTVTSFDPNDPNDSWINASVKYQKYLGWQNIIKPVGGVRIANIIDTDPVNNGVPVKKYFKYESELVINPIDIAKDYIALRREPIQDLGTCWKDYDARNSTTQSALGSIKGGVIGYGKVITLYGQNGENGKTISIFSNEPDANIDQAKIFPYPPTTSRDNRRGLLLSEAVYDKDGRLMKKDSSVYSFNQKNKITVYKLGSNKKVHTEDANDIWYNSTNSWVHFVYYDIVSEQTKKNASLQITYDDSGLNPVTTTTNYYYDTPENLQPVRREVVDSKGNILKTIQRTPLEKSAINTASPLSATASIAIDSMLRKNIVNTVIQTEEYDGSTLKMRGTIYNKVWASNVVAPENLQLQISSNAPEMRVQFTNYDSYGNLLEQQKSNDVKYNYIYDYNNTYPVAEIINGDASSVAQTSFETTNGGGWSYSTINLPTSLQTPTGKKYFPFTNGTITKSGLLATKKYIVSFWYQGGTVSVNGTLSDVKTRSGKDGWTYKEMKVTGTTSITISGSGNIDELRLYPLGAQMNTFTYDPLFGVTTKTDVNNFITYYQYDDFGRLKYIRDHKGNILKNYQYHFLNQN